MIKDGMFTLEIRNEVRVFILTILFQLVIEDLAYVIKQKKKEKKGVGEVNMFFFTDGIIISVQNYKGRKSSIKLLELIIAFNKNFKIQRQCTKINCISTY